MTDGAAYPLAADDEATAAAVEAEVALLARLRAQTWRRQAACRGVAPELFYPPRGDMAGLEEAKAICAGCPVREPCAEDGRDELFGVWGGLSGRDRRRRGRR